MASAAARPQPPIASQEIDMSRSLEAGWAPTPLTPGNGRAEEAKISPIVPLTRTMENLETEGRISPFLLLSSCLVFVSFSFFALFSPPNGGRTRHRQEHSPVKGWRRGAVVCAPLVTINVGSAALVSM